MTSLITLDENTPSIKYLCKKDKRFKKVFSMVGSISYFPHSDGYAFLVREIIEQMLSIKVADNLYERMKNICGGTVSPDIITALSDEQILTIGISRRKVKAIRSLTQEIEHGNIVFDDFVSMTDNEIMNILTGIYGIGTWTAKMYLIFVLDRQDVLPFEDAAFLQGYAWTYNTSDFSPTAVQHKCKKWKPFSSVAARYMYKAFDRKLTKQKFHLFK